MLDEEAQVVPVGPPIDPRHTYIVDEEGNRVETGISGELVIGGDLLARGYLNLPEPQQRHSSRIRSTRYLERVCTRRVIQPGCYHPAFLRLRDVSAL